MNGLQDWREWRESIDRALENIAKILTAYRKETRQEGPSLRELEQEFSDVWDRFVTRPMSMKTEERATETNELQDWREMVDRSLTRLADVALDQTGVLRKLLERVEALERRTDWVCVAEESTNVIDPVPQMQNDDLFRVGEPFALTYQSPEDAPTIVESSP